IPPIATIEPTPTRNSLDRVTDPQTPAEYVARGRQQLNYARFDEAYADFEKAMSLSGWRYGPAYVAEAELNSLRGDHNAALTAYNDAIRVDPMLAAAYDGRGMLYLNHLNKPQEAFDRFEQGHPA
ncbi:MAG: hypothetical protein HY870_13135, partial [Chloroflexi bacterium]|nr:hypothetical protein [Chloroflexota bacterium]